MVVYRNIDSVWINTSNGVTVYFSHNHMAGYMSGSVNTACGVPQIQTFGKCESIADGRRQLYDLTQKDADKIFAEIQAWDMNKNYPLELYQEASLTEPMEIKYS